MHETSVSLGDPASQLHLQRRIEHWDELARVRDPRKGLGGNYRRRLAKVYGFLVAPGLRVAELGCAQGDLLAAMNPSVGVGVDFSGEMLSRARERYPSL